MCRVLGVSRSGYYAWQRRSESKRIQRNKELLGMINRVYGESRRTYGSPRVYAQLKSDGVQCGRHRVAKLMKRHGIVAQRQRRYKIAAATKRGRNIADNLLNQRFDVSKTNKVWASDISVFWTGSGWLHLAIVMDLCSRRVIGWAMKSRMTEELTIDSLNMALDGRKIESSLMHHSDQGSQYVSERFRTVMRNHSITCSMSRKGSCYDNAVVESFFKTIKIELTREMRFKTREEARSAIFEYIEIFYNRRRLHSTLGYQSPVEYEKQLLT